MSDVVSTQVGLTVFAVLVGLFVFRIVEILADGLRGLVYRVYVWLREKATGYVEMPIDCPENPCLGCRATDCPSVSSWRMEGE